ncbi:MAG: hypothetical protein C0469_00265, partial [Cyanobacteria bacterium DS2.3.42]|nr:hypothetical protein [Cyanobacteria bacterium DS2.3.42]
MQFIGRRASITMQLSTSVSEDRELYQRLVRGPAFLLLGQGYLSLQSKSDPFLSAVAKKYAETSSVPNAQSYDVILNSAASKDPSAAFAWMQQRAERIAVPDWLQIVSGYAWNGVFSSAIEDVWVRGFKSEWREVQMLFDDKYKPLDPRNRHRLHCHFLFGSVSGPERSDQAPLHKFDWLKRKQIAVSLARRLPELVSPMGALVIEGYRGNDDWLNLDDLLPILDELGEGQTHIFSVSEELVRDSYIELLRNTGKVVLHQESLASCLTRGDEAGFLALGERPDDHEHAGSIRLEKSVILLPKEVRNQVLRSATILDDSTMLEPSALSEEALYREFRMFLSESSSVPIWSGYSRGFAFVRPFEQHLHSEVESQLRGKSASERPIILHGQAGTGKTVSLGQLAFNIRKQGIFPVLFIERKSKRPASFDIATFCKFVEDRDASCTLVVWDGMIDVQQYDDLLQTLNGLGRKVVLVGSSYRIERNEQERGLFIEASAKLTADEVKSLKHFLARFDSSLNDLVDREIKRWGDNFLVAMYRSLPYTRAAIRHGLEREVGFTVNRMEKRSKTVKIAPVAGTMAHALWKAGLISKEPILENVSDEI